MRPSSRAPVAAQIIGLITLLPYAASLKLPRCTVAVAGANGRVGSAVCRTLLREHPQVTVRALVRSAKDPYKGYGRLSYEVGAEDGNMDLKAAWAMDDETGRFASPQTMEFDADVQGGYGLDRLEIRECELRYSKDVDEALSDVDAVIWCASAFNSQRQRIPDRLDDAARAIDQRGMALFELRLGKALFGEEEKADGTDPARREAAAGKTADEDGLSLACKTLGSTRRRRATLAELTGGQAADSQRGGIVTPLVVLSASAALGYDEDKWGGPPQENEFGFRKRNGEATVSGSGLPHVIVRSVRGRPAEHAPFHPQRHRRRRRRRRRRRLASPFFSLPSRMIRPAFGPRAPAAASPAPPLAAHRRPSTRSRARRAWRCRRSRHRTPRRRPRSRRLGRRAWWAWPTARPRSAGSIRATSRASWSDASSR